MISSAVLEQPGKWRAVGVAAVLLLAVLPNLLLLWQTVAAGGSESAIPPHFAVAVYHGLRLAGLVTVLSFAAGLPTGIASALYEFRGRTLLLGLVALPPVVPSFLWAIGWSALGTRLGPVAQSAIAGTPGCLLVFTTVTTPLVLLTAYAACAAVSGSQIDAARLAGGERGVVMSAARHAAVPALVAAALGGVLTLSNPGPGQIFGLRTAASEILVSFSALYDFGLAGRQCALVTGLVMVLAVPLAWLAAPRLARQMFAKQSRGVRRAWRTRMGVAVTAALGLLVLASSVAPIIGLLLPLLGEISWPPIVTQDHATLMLLAASAEVAQTGFDTIIYAVGAGAVAVSLAWVLAACVGRSDRLRMICLGTSLALVALPPSFAALGVVRLGASAPAWADPLLRSRFTVCLDLGLRCVPIAAIIGLRAWGATPASWALAAGVHGVPLSSYLWRVLLPQLRPAAAVALLVVALLATADVTTALLLHPPGMASFPLAIFTVMANARESLVASLCLAYVAVACVLLAGLWGVSSARRA